MSVRRFVLAFALVLGTAHCADHPAAVQPSFDPAPHFLRWRGRAAPQFKATAFSASRAAPLSLDQYTVSFWAVRGQERSAGFNYRDALGETSHPFLIVTISDPVALQDSTFAEGDSVLVTVTIDTTKVGVTFEPAGLQFGELAYLQLWYGGADGDLNPAPRPMIVIQKIRGRSAQERADRTQTLWPARCVSRAVVHVPDRVEQSIARRRSQPVFCRRLSLP